MTARNSNIQPWLMLFGPNGYTISSTSCGSAAGACLDAVLPDYGTYQVYARSSANQGGYRLLFDFGDDKTDEPNNSPDDWANISLGGPHFAAIDPVGDVLHGTPESIRAAVAQSYAALGNPHMVMAGCEIPSGTPPANLAALCAPLPYAP